MTRVRGILLAALVVGSISLYTALWIVPFYVMLIPKLVFRAGWVQRSVDRFNIFMGDQWLTVVRGVLWNALPTRWEIDGTDSLDPDQWVVLTSNHQSWADPLVIVCALHGKIAFPKFFIKKQLVWLPFFGQVFWALGFPLMSRYSREFLEKYPERRGEDLDETRRACRRFRYRPVTVINFLEGTRFKPERHAKQESPFRNLLRPRAGGIHAVIEGLGDRIEEVVDVTILYPPGKASFWELLSGGQEYVRVHVETIPIPEHFFGGDYLRDTEYRRVVQGWVREIWERKDAFIDHARAAHSTAPRPSEPSR